MPISISEIRGKVLSAFILASLCAGLCVGSFGCSHLAYFPARETFLHPEKAGIQYEDLWFQASDGTRLHGWFFPAKKDVPFRGTLVQFHGNAENMTSHFASLVWMITEGYNLFAFDYRGYGQSEGSASQEGTYRDAMAAIRTVKAKVPAEKFPDLILVGQSLGGAVLMRAYEDVIDRSRIQAVIVDSTFYSYQAIGKNILSRIWLTWPFQWLAGAWVSDQYTPEDAIERISPTPFLVIHGDSDRVIPFAFGQKIFAQAKEPKTFLRIEGGQHLDSMFRSQGKYRQNLIEFLDQARKRPKNPENDAVSR